METLFTRKGKSVIISPAQSACVALLYAPVAQLDRVLDSDSKGRWFESSRAYQSPLYFLVQRGFLYVLHKRERGSLLDRLVSQQIIFRKRVLGRGLLLIPGIQKVECIGDPVCIELVQ